MFDKQHVLDLQNKLIEDGFDAYLIVTGDPHSSEYVADYFLAERNYFCPFSGSAGYLLVLKNSAYFFTDGRYWIQAENELKGSGISLVKEGDKSALSFEDLLKKEGVQKLATNTNLISYNFAKRVKGYGVELVNYDYSYLVKDRGQLSKEKVFKLRDNLNSLSHLEKIEAVLKECEKDKAEACLITTLDDIAWILNIRGNDIACNPVFYSYLYLSKKGNYLFIDRDKIDFEIEGVNLLPYSQIEEFVKSHSEVATLVNPSFCSCALYNCLKNPVNGKIPSTLMKSIKGEKEIENLKRVQAEDGLAMLKFIAYLDEHKDENLSEYHYAEVLEKFRRENKDLFELSFETIAACGSNAAQMHYEPTKEKSSIVSKETMELLVDSGGQYYGGTTDTTRTFLIGEASQEYIHDYTLTLKSLIAMSRAIFLDGVSGIALDVLSRQYMWDEGMDYKCGTGHGVGYILNVHEGPNSFRYVARSVENLQKLIPGMVTTIEPGVYKENKYGIRIENNLLCVRAFETSDGIFNKFETVTYVPIETSCLDLSIMTDREIDWLNQYHKLVYEKLSPLVKDEKLMRVLKEKTKSIKR